MKLIAKTFFGLESTLAAELKTLGAKDVRCLRRAVSFEANKALLYRSTLCLRTALRILKPIAQFRATNEQELYDEVHQIDWTQILNPKKTFAIQSVSNSNIFKHSKYAALKTKDAIVDRFRKQIGYRPNVNPKDPDIMLHLHIYKDQIEIALDSSGFSLHRRAYRHQGHRAPINEALAAGMILISGWDRQTPLFDPMCGTGTILSEALMMAMNIPARYFNHNFCLQHWHDFSAQLWKDIFEKEKEKIVENVWSIYGYELEASNLEIAGKALKRITENQTVTLKCTDFFRAKKPANSGLMIMNPPYGTRINPGKINSFYNQIGSTLKRTYHNWEVWIISSNFAALKQLKLKVKKKHKLYNGALECLFQNYQLEKPTRKRRNWS